MRLILYATLLVALSGCGSSSGGGDSTPPVNPPADEVVLSIENGFLRSSTNAPTVGFVLSDDVSSESRLEFIQPQSGTVTDLGNGSFEYLPDAGSVSDSFKIRLRNDNQISTWADINVKTVSTGENVVTNYGVGGYNTNNVLNIIDNVRADYPDLAIIMVGTNDSLNSTNPVSIDDYERNLSRIVDYITSSGASVILMKIPPAISDYVLDRHPEEHFVEFGGVNETIDAYNEVVKKIASDKNLVIYDVHSLVMDHGGVFPSMDSYLRNEINRSSRDGVHLTVDGYNDMATGLYNLINDNNFNYENIATIGDSITVGVHEEKGYPDFLREKFNY